MINPYYDHESGYHDGTPVEADAKAWLGPWKSIEDVPIRYRLVQYADIVDADEAWNEFVAEYGEDWTEHTRHYVYGKAWREWTAFCEERGLHPACPDPADVESHMAIQQERTNTNQTLHDARFRPLYRWWEWMRYHVGFPLRYNPAVMAVLANGATADAWQTRVSDRIWRQTQVEREPQQEVIQND